ncbi:hypothetical protein BGZ76_006334, partial [Entomortierella beljakovae]
MYSDEDESIYSDDSYQLYSYSYNMADLPDECVYAIIDAVIPNQKGLYNLLFVNKFFFDAAIRRLFKYYTPDILNGLMDIEKQFWLTSLLLVSFLQARAKEAVDDPEDDRTPSQVVDRVLKSFNLKLKMSYHPSGIAFLQEMYNSEDGYVGPRDIKCEPNVFSALTIDYSKLATELWKWTIDIFQMDLRKYPLQTHDELGINPTISRTLEALDAEDNDEDDEDTESSRRQEFLPGYGEATCNATVDMLIHYNHE